MAAGGRPLTGVDDLYEALDSVRAGRQRWSSRVVRGTDERDVAVSFDAAEEVPHERPYSSASAHELAERELEALDAYSRTVAGVAERLAPSVANLRVTRETRRGRDARRRGQRRRADARRLPAHLGPRDRRARPPGPRGVRRRARVRVRDRGARRPLRPRGRAHRGARPGARRRSATPSACASASSWWRSATRTGSRGRSPPGVVSALGRSLPARVRAAPCASSTT